MAKNPKLLNMFKFSFDDTVWNDDIFTGITDDDLEAVLEFVAMKDLNTLTAEESYGVFLSAKREIYWKLATSTAPLYSIDVDGTSVNKNERFDHYATLLQQIDSEIQTFENSGMTSTVTMGNSYLTSRHFDKRNYENTPKPIVKVNIDNLYSDKIEISWEAKQVTKFYNYIIYINNNIIIDDYITKELGDMNIATSDSKRVFSTFDRLKTKYRITDLKPETEYHLAVVCFNANSVYGYEEITFTTLPTIIEGEE